MINVNASDEIVNPNQDNEFPASSKARNGLSFSCINVRDTVSPSSTAGTKWSLERMTPGILKADEETLQIQPTKNKEQNGACARYVIVSKFQWKPFFGLPPSEIHRMTGLPPKIV